MTRISSRYPETMRSIFHCRKTGTVLLSLLVLFSFVLSGTPAFHAEEEPEAFSNNAWEVVQDMTVGWNLGNDLDCYDDLAFGSSPGLEAETLWGNPAATEKLLKTVKDAGFNTVRLPVTWYNHMDPETYEIDPVWMERVTEVTDQILAQGMYCILNVHHDTGVNGWLTASEANLEEKEKIFTAIWNQICEQFGDYGDHLIFEGYNEILNDEKVWDTPDEASFKVANELNQLFVDLVRASGKQNEKRILYVKTYCSSSHEQSLNSFVMPKDPADPNGTDGRIIVGVHIYRPFDFTHEDYPEVTSWNSYEMDLAMEHIHDRFIAKGIPVVVGEFGCADKNNDEQRITWANYFMREANEYDLKACWWDEGNRYKLFNRYTGSAAEPELLAAIMEGSRGEVYEPGNSAGRTAYELKEDLSLFLSRAMRQDSIRMWGPAAACVLVLLVLAYLGSYLYEKIRKAKWPTYDDLYDEKPPLAYGIWSRFFIVAASFFTLLYLIWRIVWSVPLQYGVFAIAANVILLILEIIGFVESQIHYMNILGTRDHPLPKIADEEYPDVDLFIATYNEPTDLLRLTINGCKHLKYPDPAKVHIWVCDDKRRPQMRQLAEEMGVGYFDRPDNQGAKAGNLNHAMGLTHSPYVVTLDADMIVRSDFLLKTIPYFIDAEKKAKEKGKEHIRLGFIQTPQCFYDPDVFQHALYSEQRAPNEQNFFYQAIEPARTSTNSVIYGGSNTILSRKAIEEIGGFYTGSITEDFATGMLIESAGYVSLSLPEPLASGRTPHTYREHIQQRTRWGRGVIVTAKKLKLMTRKGLSPQQRMSYWGSVAYWYSPIKVLVYSLSPLLFAVFGVVVFRCTLADLLIYWLPSFIMSDLCLWAMSHRVISLKWSGIYETCVMPHMLIPILQESLGISLTKFIVTNKNAEDSERKRDVRAMVPFLILIALTLFGIIRTLIGVKVVTFVNTLIILFWLVRNLYFYLMALFLIDGRDSDGEPVNVIDAELVSLKSAKSQKVYDGVTSRMNMHCMKIYLDEGGLRIGESVSVSIIGSTAQAELSGVVIGCRHLRHGNGTMFTVEIIDYLQDELEYMQILFDRIPSLPQQLTFRDFGVVYHLWHNIAVRLSRSE